MHCTPPPDLIAMNMELNRAPYVIGAPKNAGDFDENGFEKDWGGLEHFKKHGGGCEWWLDNLWDEVKNGH